jgi:hypothetical protein
MSQHVLDNRCTLICPITYKRVHFSEKNKENKTINNISYTDCHEISILRFLHIIFSKYDEKTKTLCFDLDKLKNHVDKSSEIYKYFSHNKIIEQYDSWYSTHDGVIARTKWCNFLNKRKYFKYKIDNKYELCASLYNLEQFFRMFFPKIKFPPQEYFTKCEEYEDYYRNIIDIIFETFGMTGEICVTHKIVDCDKEPFCHYCKNVLIHDQMLLKEAVIKIMINGENVYTWDIFEFFQYSEKYLTGRITGHSELHYAVDLVKWSF